MTADIRYPLGKFTPRPFSPGLKREWLQDIQFLPALLENAIEHLDNRQLDTPYREGGWTVRQLVHHLADCAVNAYERYKLTLSEENPVIKTIQEEKWANMPDVQSIPVSISITLLYALHTRLYAAIRDLDAAAWNRCFFHPVKQCTVSLWDFTGEYAFHGKHHTAHIINLRKKMGWVLPEE
jgi:DinB superfamily